MSKLRLKAQRDGLIVALDVANSEEALEFCRLLLPEVDFFKVGFELFCAEGWPVVKAIKELGALVFLDLKLFDIPNQVRQAAAVISSFGVDMFTVHCLGGLKMLQAAAEGAKEGALKAGVEPPAIVGVTVLTSMDPEDLTEVGLNPELELEVAMLASLAHEAGLAGVVASGRELPAIKKELQEELMLVTPGVRVGTVSADDQKRVLTPAEAVKLGSNFLVVGRPIIKAANPKEVALDITKQIKSARSKKQRAL